MTTTRTATTEERAVVLAYLLALSVRPVEGERAVADPLADRPPLRLKRARLAEEWDTYADLLKIRHALRRIRPSDKRLGRNGFTRALEEVADRALALSLARASDAAAEVETARAASPEWRDRIAGKPGPYATGSMTSAKFFDAFPDLAPAEEVSPTESRRATAVSTLAHGSTPVVRLRRDHAQDGADLWDEIAETFGYGDRDGLLDRAEDLGLSLTDPIPSEWVLDVREAGDWDDDEDDDEDDDADNDETPAPVETLAEVIPLQRVARPRLTDEERAARKAAREAEEQASRDESERRFAERMAAVYAATPVPTPEERAAREAEVAERNRLAREYAEDLAAHEAKRAAEDAAREAEREAVREEARRAAEEKARQQRLNRRPHDWEEVPLDALPAEPTILPREGEAALPFARRYARAVSELEAARRRARAWRGL